MVTTLYRAPGMAENTTGENTTAARVPRHPRKEAGPRLSRGKEA
jgi:hypothetical protein